MLFRENLFIHNRFYDIYSLRLIFFNFESFLILNLLNEDFSKFNLLSSVKEIKCVIFSSNLISSVFKNFFFRFFSTKVALFYSNNFDRLLDLLIQYKFFSTNNFIKFVFKNLFLNTNLIKLLELHKMYYSNNCFFINSLLSFFIKLIFILVKHLINLIEN